MSKHIERVQRFIDEQIPAQASLRVLEAGCGSCSWFDFRQRARIIGIDVSEKQLHRNKLLHEAIHGDLMVHRFAPGGFDLIVCIDVLEHLPRPEAALANMREALAPGGLLVLKLPNALSWKGLFTKLTPHALHVWVYRHLLGRPQAGLEDTGPFKTFMRLSISPHALRRWARASGLAVAYEDYYQAWSQARLRAKLGPADLLVRLLEVLSRGLSLNQVSISRTEYILVLRAAEPVGTWRARLQRPLGPWHERATARGPR